MMFATWSSMRRAEEDDALLEQHRVDVEGALAAGVVSMTDGMIMFGCVRSVGRRSCPGGSLAVLATRLSLLDSAGASSVAASAFFLLFFAFGFVRRPWPLRPSPLASPGAAVLRRDLDQPRQRLARQEVAADGVLAAIGREQLPELRRPGRRRRWSGARSPRRSRASSLRYSRPPRPPSARAIAVGEAPRSASALRRTCSRVRPMDAR